MRRQCQHFFIISITMLLVQAHPPQRRTVGFRMCETGQCQLTCSSKTSWTPSNSFSNLSLSSQCHMLRTTQSSRRVTRNRGSADGLSAIHPLTPHQFPIPPAPKRTQWASREIVCNGIPRRKLLICLILVCARQAHRSGAEAGTVDSQSNRGLHPGSGQLGSSNKAGRTDGARRKTEEGSRGHNEQDRTDEASELGVLRREGGGERSESWDRLRLKSPRGAPGFWGGVRRSVCLRQKRQKMRLPWPPEGWVPEAITVS